MDLLLDKDTHDLVFENGRTEVTDERVDVIAQRLTIRLKTFLGEWRYNINYGIPYYQQILGLKNRKEDVDTVFQIEILKEPGVNSILSFESSLDSKRQYRMKFSAQIDTGEVMGPLEIIPGA